MPRVVVDAVTAHMALEAEIGGYEAAGRRAEALEAVYHSSARLIGADWREIAQVESATRAWQMAFYSVPLNPGDRILTCTAEYPGNYAAMLHRAGRDGAEIVVVPDDETGAISLDALRAVIDERVKFIAITHIPTNDGLVNPVAEVGSIAREACVLYLLDACQSAGQIPLDVDEIGCDMLAATSRKYLRGPRGAAFLYVRGGVAPRLDPPLIDHTPARQLSLGSFELYDDARRFETWEACHAVRLGFGAAIDYALTLGVEEIRDRVVWLAARLREQVAGVRGVRVRDRATERSGLVCFTVEGYSPEAVRVGLGARGVHVYTRPGSPLDVAAGRPDPVVRASVHYYNTEDELDRLCEALDEVLRSTG
jgi:selenocysteine lyase/cysteine desulfurase